MSAAAAIAPPRQIRALIFIAKVNPWTNASGGLAPSLAAAAARSATIAPVIAMPSATPTWRNVFSTPDATPALSTGAAPIAAADIGVITNDIPRPPRMNAGSMCQNEEWRFTVESQRQQTATTDMPPAISQREPTWSESFPAIGAKITTISVQGSRAAPACVGDQPRNVCM